jgi:hypothetical protein
MHRLGAGHGVGHGVDVRGVRLWAEPDNTRVVLDLSGSAQHTLAVLRHPDRVIVDVPGARVASGARVVPSGVGAVEHIRLAGGPRGELRLVIDLSHPIRAKSFLVQPNSRYGYRLVIDLGSAGLPAVVAASTSPGAGSPAAGSPAAGSRGGSVAPIKVEHRRPDARDLIIRAPSGRTVLRRRTWSWRSRARSKRASTESRACGRC